MLNFWGPKKDKKVINSSTKCLISVKIAIMTPHIIPLPLVNVWLIFDLQKYVNWLSVFSKVNPFFQKAQVFCMDLQPAADPYNVVCSCWKAHCPFHAQSKRRLWNNTVQKSKTGTEWNNRSAFYTRLCTQAAKCNFDNADKEIRIQITSHCHSTKFRQILLEKALSLSEVVEKARS